MGEKTNNQAEYLALLLGLFYARKHLKTGDVIHIISDSELLVRQLIGKYSVKNNILKKMHACAMALLKDHNYHFTHVLREHNKIADELANKGIEQKIHIPQEFLEMWCLHE